MRPPPACSVWSQREVRANLKIHAAVLDDDPLAAVYDCHPWEPWPPQLAAERFLAEMARLRTAIDAEAGEKR